MDVLVGTGQKYSSEWWSRQDYVDVFYKAIKIRRLKWVLGWTLLAKWMPYFIVKQWFAKRGFALFSFSSAMFPRSHVHV